MRALVLVLVTACSFKADFDLPYDVPELTIQGTDYGKPAPFSFIVDLSQSPEPPVSGVSTVTLSSVAFSITKGSGCFNFINDVTIWIESAKSGSTLERAVVATGSAPGCVDKMALEPTTVNIKPYLDEGATILATGTGIPPADTVSFDGRVVLHASL